MFDLYGFLNVLLINTGDDSLGWLKVPYLAFNSIEALCWCWCAGFVAVRYRRQRKTRLELPYALAFFAFGLSDLIETCGTTPLLLLFKGACLLAIIGFRNPIRAMYGNRYL